MIAALFDIEGTLYTNPMGRGFMRFASSNGRKLWAFAYFVSLMPKYYLSGLRITSKETLNRTAIARMPWLIHGYDLRQAEAAFNWVANRFILPSGRESVLERWDYHRRLGHLLVIASGGLAPCVQLIGSHLNAIHWPRRIACRHRPGESGANSPIGVATRGAIGLARELRLCGFDSRSAILGARRPPSRRLSRQGAPPHSPGAALGRHGRRALTLGGPTTHWCRRGVRRRGNAHLPAIPEVIE